MSSKALLVVIPDRLSELVNKGEITNRYYNPGNLFDEVHVLMTNNDCLDPVLVQKTVGKAQLHLHNLPMLSFRRTLGWQPILLRSWIAQGVLLAKKIQPKLIRAHGIFGNGYLAAQIRKQVGIPFVVSLHTHPDADVRRTTPWWPTWRERLGVEFYRRFERETLRVSDCVVIVYEPQREYVLRNGARNVHLIYNTINTNGLRQKDDYQLHDPPRILSVGRQFKEKNPENIIRSMVRLNATLTLVGDGPYHEYLRTLTQILGVDNRVKFIKALPNDELCKQLVEYDIFAVHCDYWGIPKAVMEPLLAGLPVVVNRRKPEPTPELDGDWVLAVENTEDSYRRALSDLLGNYEQRATLGRRGYEYAWEHFAPDKSERQIVALYRELVPNL